MKRFRGGLVFKAQRLVYHSTLGLRLLKRKLVTGEQRGFTRGGTPHHGRGLFSFSLSLSLFLSLNLFHFRFLFLSLFLSLDVSFSLSVSLSESLFFTLFLFLNLHFSLAVSLLDLSFSLSVACWFRSTMRARSSRCGLARERSYLTESIHKFDLQNLIPTQIHQLILYCY